VGITFDIDATPAEMQAAVASVVGEARVNAGRSCPSDQLLPAPFRSGASVPCMRSSGNGPLWQSRHKPCNGFAGEINIIETKKAPSAPFFRQKRPVFSRNTDLKAALRRSIMML